MTFAIERLIDKAAARARLRPHRAAPPEPRSSRRRCRTATRSACSTTAATTKRTWTAAMAIADWDGFAARKRDGASSAASCSGAASRITSKSSIGAPKEQARITVRPEGRVDVVIGTQPSGQGHETSFAQVVADLLRRAGREGEDHPGRHRCGESRRRHAFGPLDAARRDGVFQGAAPTDRQGQAASRRRCSTCTPDQVDFDDGRFVGARHQPQLRFSRARRRKRRNHDAAGRSQGRARRRHRQRDARPGVSQRLRHLRDRGRSRDRRWSTSRATPRSTMSGAASIR